MRISDESFVQSIWKRPAKERLTVRSISRSSARQSCISFTRHRQTCHFHHAPLNGFAT